MTFNPLLGGLNEPKNQKKRGIKSTQWPQINFGTGAFIILNEGKLNYFHLDLLKKNFKRFTNKLHQYFNPLKRVISLNKMGLRKVKIEDIDINDVRLKKCFLFHLHINCPITKKSKNSRMGKGKGLLVRWSLRNKRLFKLVEFRFVSLYKIKKIFLNLKDKYPCKLKLLIKKESYKNNVLSLNKEFVWTQHKKIYLNYQNNLYI